MPNTKQRFCLSTPNSTPQYFDDFNELIAAVGEKVLENATKGNILTDIHIESCEDSTNE